jgi:hypothetical protein
MAKKKQEESSNSKRRQPQGPPRKNPLSEDEFDLELQAKRASKREELGKMEHDDLAEAYRETYQVEPEEDATDEDLIEAIIAGTEETPSPKDHVLNTEVEYEPVFGNQNDEIAIPTQIAVDDQGNETNWRENIVAKLTNTRVVEGEIVELKSTVRYQVFTPDDFDRLLKNKFFSQSRIRVELLNRPKGTTKEAKNQEL